MASVTPSLKATDLLAVKSRVSWGAISAGAMVALAIYFLLTLTGVAIGFEAAARRPEEVARSLGLGLAISSIAILLISMFFGGWATSRLAVGETKLEAVLYGVILWGVLFMGMLWLNSTGVRIGFGAILGVASGTVVTGDDSTGDRGRFDEGQARKMQENVKGHMESLNDPASLPGKLSSEIKDPAARDMSRMAAWYSLAGVVASMVAVIFGSLIGSGDLPVPVPILGVRRRVADPRL